MVSQSGSVTILRESLEMFSLPVMSESSFSFTDVERIAIPTGSPIYYLRSLRAAKPVFVWKERLNPANVGSEKLFLY